MCAGGGYPRKRVHKSLLYAAADGRRPFCWSATNSMYRNNMYFILIYTHVCVCVCAYACACDERYRF